jgi:hypothetical protein
MAKDFRNAENKMPVWYLFENIHAEPFTELHNPLLMREWAEVAAFTRKGQ